MTRNIDLARLAEHHRVMVRIRAFEETAKQGLDEKLVLGAIHLSIGQEAVATGVCLNLNRDDILLSTHRGHGHTIAKGADSTAMMRELFGREGGNCGGKGGSMHIADFGVGMLGANGVVSANIVIAVGAAHAIKLRRENRVVCCMFGDGAINRGPFLEGLNWAGVFNLPVLFVCEDNGFAATTRTRTMTSGDGPLARAKALGIPGVTVDGNDVLAVEEATRSLLDDVRSGKGARFLHAVTYRLTGHTAVDPAAYRQKQEVDEKWQSDPIARVEALLGDAHSAGITKAREDALREMQNALNVARDTPYPDVSQAFADVQDIGDPRKEAF
ncbi:acetoin:2,6-dichlorophenolindophenol oxidoreductase subunit alpha [Variibacter gotjawalensis]|uniref:Acetoin:2,6-dichlorophenolindophenol oxidoreductase subunit alpha n=1 Tax=Variibacter gotjawalensis TaxID=1333996 RepID=A0A0S3PQ83_9BRAD|nr:thiamine pyrophosphate-dependent dehydrogenase E1 component subunit alpha [Variibacter gotjawalensis]NIK48407.1 pyruvate dehydrogenase E1 component alpha subunit [Variibacter gotjawalensis]RZS50274.1 pyruvate dehydrogenase E1 component alpha subunit [Variibacter gotjawalensis]BAT58107.1 acetoin:2,6-dichlorophenolindophenol oxidoreductase subunit alpha [Variibacter gotjawalensis]